MDANSHHIATVNAGRIELFQGLVTNLGISEGLRSCGCEDIEPAGSDHSCPEGLVARINEMDLYQCLTFPS